MWIPLSLACEGLTLKYGSRVQEQVGIETVLQISLAQIVHTQDSPSG